MLRENGDWKQYIDVYELDPWTGTNEPDLPGISIIDQAGKFNAIRYGSYDTQGGVQWVQQEVDDKLGLSDLIHPPFLKYKIYPKKPIPFWWLVAYLIIGPDGWVRKDIAELAREKPDKRFNETIKRYMMMYLNEGKMPPTDVAPVILNLVDDMFAGREMNLRAGDYITIQNHIRKQGKSMK